ncbi:DUF4054 domain-containing protein [Mycobacteroides abscessus]|uniref:DUF4054 domain-containing protein n=1 Tax=Mycobacteroides abscessus TaxID=36809 RepID=UPI000C269F04
MAKTTPARVRAIAKHLVTLSDEELDVVIDDALMEVQDHKVKEAHEERLTRYLAAHLASLNIRQATLEKVADLQKGYNSNDLAVGKGLELTPYGQEYKRLLVQYSRPKFNLTVI